MVAADGGYPGEKYMTDRTAPVGRIAEAAAGVDTANR
jgi:hypothetical protein